ncbi:exosome nuclease subunit [Entomortierella beljakovae]|nr:exosome nuclease subunit [Entomortierella beljakovae]
MASSNILTDFDAWQAALFATLVKATKAANAIPASDVTFYRTFDRTFASDMEDISISTLDMCNELMRQAGGPSTVELKDSDDVNDSFDIVTDVVDNMLEKVDVALDDMKAPRKKGIFIPQSAPVTEKLELKLIHAQNIARPQLQFPDPIDNSTAPFIRKIKYKPNAKVDLNYGIEQASTDSSSSDQIIQPHPYEYEIKNLEYPQHMFEQRPEQLYLPFDTTTAIWVETEDELKDMCKTLEMQREIAIDLEHHNYRSFQGFVSLMQISTRDQDYIIDTLELRGSLHLLNQSFTDPNIVKVLHGAESDIIWLQRDFGVYIVNMFDTYHASKLLEFGSHSLAHLLKLYADFDADKRYQLADWRIRPLPKEMFNYARSDTHFLLYIYDRMRNALLDKSNPTTHNLLQATLLRSSETCLKKHEKEIYDAESGEGPGGWRNMYSKWNRSLNNVQFAVFKALHAWRDQLARDEDESIRYVLPNHMLFSLAEKMPEESAGVLGCCNPVPPPIRMNASDVALLISHTKSSVAPMVGGYKRVAIDVPVHVRFDPKTGLQGTQEPKATNEASSSVNQTSIGKTEQSNNTKATSAISKETEGSRVTDTKSTRLVIDPTPLLARSSALFGGLKPSAEISDEEEGKRLASKIMAQLSAKPSAPAPVFKEITNTHSMESIKEPVVEKPKVEEEKKEIGEEEAKPKRTDVLILSSMSKKRARAIDEDRAELSQGDGSAISSDAEGEESETVSVKKKKKKNKQAKKLASTSTTPSSSTPASGDEMPESFQPFDYNSVRSVVDENVEDLTSGKRKKKKKGAVEANPAFDPYSKLVEGAELKKKDATFSRNPKSGARSMTFSKK